MDGPPARDTTHPAAPATAGIPELTPTTTQERAHGALAGLAIGDALGMPTQTLTRAQVVHRYGRMLDDFHPGPPDHRLAAGLPAGSVTDDTEQTLLLARVLIDHHGRVPAQRWARDLLTWEQAMRERGSHDLLGPSTRAALADLQAGMSPERTGRRGTTNGAAMRITPVGLAVAVDPATGDGLPELVTAVVAASRLTHATSVALSGACAIAAAVSAGVGGGDRDATFRMAMQAAELGARSGATSPDPRVLTGLRSALTIAAECTSAADLSERVARELGTSLATEESVPAAFAIAAGVSDDPWAAVRIAASIGGDCDTIAAMTGAVLGARTGAQAFPAAAVASVERVNGLDLSALARSLLELRHPR